MSAFLGDILVRVIYLREIERERLGRFHFLGLLEFLGWFLCWHGLSPSGGLRRWALASLYANRGPNVQTKESARYVRANVWDTMAGPLGAAVEVC